MRLIPAHPMPEHAPIPITRLRETGSTNLDARGRIGSENAPFWIVAQTQTGGRGRDGRAWSSPPGGLWATLAWPLSSSPPRVLDGLGLRLGVALSETIAGFCHDARLKWPNDVLVGGEKIAGVLTEVIDAWALVGCGVNVANDPPPLPPPARATSLAKLLPAPPTPDEVLAALTPRLIAALTREGIAHDLDRARSLLAGVNETCVVHSRDGSERRATLEGLDDAGRAVYRDASGAEFLSDGAVLQEPG